MALDSKDDNKGQKDYKITYIYLDSTGVKVSFGKKN